MIAHVNFTYKSTYRADIDIPMTTDPEDLESQMIRAIADHPEDWVETGKEEAPNPARVDLCTASFDGITFAFEMG